MDRIMKDESMSDADPEASYLPLSDDEHKVLALYDKLQELRLEIAIINAQARQIDDLHEGSPDELEQAQAEMLEARAKYMLRNQVVEEVLMANPILKAVHSGRDATAVESDLLPHIEQRDNVSISIAKQSADMANIKSDMTNTQIEAIRATRENVALASQVFDLADQVKRKKGSRPNDPKILREIEKLEQDVKTSGQRWRVIKGVASGVVVGSGVDWARDDALCDIVLDPEDE
ncbi:centromere protein H (CENP-H) domain-containing protein [Sarocladium implicatum]|nr:centromere protein H (CENP-H) domain-containing protein [Sarocladium implicatum]